MKQRLRMATVSVVLLAAAIVGAQDLAAAARKERTRRQQSGPTPYTKVYTEDDAAGVGPPSLQSGTSSAPRKARSVGSMPTPTPTPGPEAGEPTPTPTPPESSEETTATSLRDRETTARARVEKARSVLAWIEKGGGLPNTLPPTTALNRAANLSWARREVAAAEKALAAVAEEAQKAKVPENEPR